MTTVAIDFGTSNTIVSIIEPHNQQPKSLKIPQSRIFQTSNGEVPVIPSLLFFSNSNGNSQIYIGEQVRSRKLGLNKQFPPERLFKRFKRDLAADFQPPGRTIDNEHYDSPRVSSIFIRQIWDEIKKLKITPKHLVFTVPVGAFERYLDWFRELGENLGIDRVSVIDESTAAALGYAINEPGKLILVVDFGGGTLDLSLVRTVVKERGELRAEVVAKSEAYVGGEDIDNWIIEDYLRNKGLGKEGVNKIAHQNLLEIAERIKIKLSLENEAKEGWFDEQTFTSYEIKVNRDKLENILENNQFLPQLRNSLDEIVMIALEKGIRKGDIERILLVGGSCLIPAVQQLVKSYFGPDKVRLEKPFEAVCHGALAIEKIKNIDDFLRHTYAIRIWSPQKQGYTYHTIFEKGTKYPCKSREWLTLQVANEGQKEIRLDLGEIGDISHAEVTFDERGRMTTILVSEETYRSLDINYDKTCLARLDPVGILGSDRIKVLFEVNSSRILVATVKDLLTGEILADRKEIYRM
ncbi:Hsp70 family protein [Cylindrospermopsis raciborskii]|uniref:Hsp70 family protein n=1 Tax=Cylindrospermopsis raciborskii TaxID=77022 RepID=UPI0022BB5C62|nr:Hsp70 family protein [Cylindrospermopsis raciborskii]MCZ2203123.1 Hsp70 family protein [Cylindrospermopsis raciborskii PAMP2012]MCZ2207748.1 Hsp70 family protein [Cylindrospermopsis raciborskii PAMP2011]